MYRKVFLHDWRFSRIGRLTVTIDRLHADGRFHLGRYQNITESSERRVIDLLGNQHADAAMMGHASNMFVYQVDK